MPPSTTKRSKPARKPLLRAVRIRILPLTVTMLSLVFLIKINELYMGGRALSDLVQPRSAQAAAKEEEGKEDKKDEKKEEKKDEATSEEDAKKEEGKEEGGHGEKKEEKEEEEEPKTLGTGKTTIKAIEELKAKQSQVQFTQTELDILQNLVKRREEIEKREAEFEIKSAVLAATGKRISDKVAEMKALQADLSKVVEAYNKHQDAEIRGLVKIYETMKPADAATIFNELEMPILLAVIDKMSERKVAPVLAGMNPKRARDVTQQLAELRRSRVNSQKAAEAASAAAQGK